MFKGVFTALLTPFKNQEVDYPSLEKLINHQLEQGIQGFVVCGTTGESATLTPEEQLEVLDFVCKKVNKQVPILFGSGSNNTKKTVEWSKKACEYPIDGLLVVVPYYNKPPQPGLLAHFKKVADEVPKPVVLYNVPGRTVAQLEPSTIIELSKHKNIVGIKEANGDLSHFDQYKNAVPDDFCLLSGDDGTSIEFCFSGGHGIISVCSHIAPAKMVEWIKRAIEKDDAVKLEFETNKKWINGLYVTANPIPVKYGVYKKGLIESDETRLPLISMEDHVKKTVDVAFSGFEELL